MKIDKRNRFYGIGALLFISIHFGFIFMYAAPPKVTNKSVQSVVSGYVLPVFQQTWNLFAPCPIINSYTEVAFQFDEKKRTDWIRVGEDALNKHALTKVLHFGELVLIESNLMHDVNYGLHELGVGDTAAITITQADFPNYNPYGFMGNRIRRYLRGYSQALYGEVATVGFFRCWRKNVKTLEEGVIEFEPFKFAQ